MASADKLMHWQLHLSEFELDVVHCVGIKHQETDKLSRPKRRGIDREPNDEDTSLQCITPLQPPKKEASVCCTHDSDENDNKECAGLSAWYAIATWTNGNTMKKRSPCKTL